MMMGSRVVLDAGATLVLWTVAAVATAALVVLVGYRWARHGRRAAFTPMLTAALVGCVITLVWVFPGVVAGAAIAVAAGFRLRQGRQDAAVES